MEKVKITVLRLTCILGKLVNIATTDPPCFSNGDAFPILHFMNNEIPVMRLNTCQTYNVNNKLAMWISKSLDAIDS
jgi:hypothetical protein